MYLEVTSSEAINSTVYQISEQQRMRLEVVVYQMTENWQNLPTKTFESFALDLFKNILKVDQV